MGACMRHHEALRPPEPVRRLCGGDGTLGQGRAEDTEDRDVMKMWARG